MRNLQKKLHSFQGHTSTQYEFLLFYLFFKMKFFKFVGHHTMKQFWQVVVRIVELIYGIYQKLEINKLQMMQKMALLNY